MWFFVSPILDVLTKHLSLDDLSFCPMRLAIKDKLMHLFLEHPSQLQDFEVITEPRMRHRNTQMRETE